MVKAATKSHHSTDVVLVGLRKLEVGAQTVPSTDRRQRFSVRAKWTLPLWHLQKGLSFVSRHFWNYLEQNIVAIKLNSTRRWLDSSLICEKKVRSLFFFCLKPLESQSLCLKPLIGLLSMTFTTYQVHRVIWPGLLFHKSCMGLKQWAWLKYLLSSAWSPRQPSSCLSHVLWAACSSQPLSLSLFSALVPQRRNRCSFWLVCLVTVGMLLLLSLLADPGMMSGSPRSQVKPFLDKISPPQSQIWCCPTTSAQKVLLKFHSVPSSVLKSIFFLIDVSKSCQCCNSRAWHLWPTPWPALLP